MLHRVWTSLGTLTVWSTLLALAWLSQVEAQGRAQGEHYTKADVERIIQRVETQSDAFTAAFDQALDRSRQDGTQREDQLNAQVQQLERALDALREEFNRRETWRETRTNVQAVLRQSDEIDRLMRARKMPPGVEDRWRAVRADLNTLAGIYDLAALK